MGLIIVCDTNVFVRETHLLRKKGGPDLVRQLRATHGRLLVPDILRTEYVEQTLEAANGVIQKFESGSSFLGTLIGFQQLPFPNQEAIKKLALDRLRALEVITLSSTLGPALLEAAGRRSIEKRRPTSKTDHGYKDCLIWESVLTLPAGSDVRFVSHDKAFFDGARFAQDLVDEAKAKDITVFGYNNLEDLVRDLRAENPTLNLTMLEDLDLVDAASQSSDDGACAYAMPLATAGATQQPARSIATAEPDIQEVGRQLSEARNRYEDLDLKILAYIAYLDSPGRDELIRVLSQAKIPIETATNILERLVISGFVRDTGNHYLVTDRSIAEIVAPIVENEIVDLLAKDLGENGD